MKNRILVFGAVAILAGCTPAPEEPATEEAAPQEEAPMAEEPKAEEPAMEVTPEAPAEEPAPPVKEEAPAEEPPAEETAEAPAASGDAVTLTNIGFFKTGGFDEGAAEIVDYDPKTKRAFVVNGEKAVISVLDLSDPTNIQQAMDIEVGDYGKEFTCVSVHGDHVAVSAVADDKQAPGKVILMSTDGEVTNTFEVGALPDNLKFSPDGKFLVVANEGEPNDEYTVDPEGSVSIIELGEEPTVTEISFAPLMMVANDVRIFGKDASIAQDLEPEFVAISPDSKTAFVVLQENNAVAVIDLEYKLLRGIEPLGFKDHSLEGNGFDASNKSDGIYIQPQPTLGMYMPDSAVATEIGGEVFLLTANEGDSRDYDGWSEEVRVEDLTLDPDKFPNAAELQKEENLGRLKTTTATGDTDGDGDHDVIYSYGARSFSIWDAEMNQVFDSGDEFEQILAERLPEVFNAEEELKDRSDDKGAEPEAIDVGVIGGKTYAFIGLERQNGIFVYDVSDPTAATFAGYADRRNYDADIETPEAGDIAPECVKFVPAARSPNGKDILIVSNEVSATVSVWEISVN